MTGQPASGTRPGGALGVVLTVTGWCLLLGAVLGVVWAGLAPRADVVTDGSGGLSLTEMALGRFFAAEVWFGGAAIVAGIVVALGTYAWRRELGPVEALACALGGVAGAMTAARVGVWLGGHPGAGLGALPAGTPVHLSLRVSTAAFGIAWPVASILVVLTLTLWLDARPQHSTASTGAG